VTGEEIGAEDEGWLTGRLIASRRPSAVEAAVLTHLERECLIGDDLLVQVAMGLNGYAA